MIVSCIAAGCVRNPPDPGTRYQGPVPPCSAEYDAPATVDHSEHPELFPAPFGDLWEPGPYPTWNTHPDTLCNRNPTIDAPDDAELDGLELYITYPAVTDPSNTGSARAAEGPFPVVVFAHANNDRRCQIFEDYWSLHDHWASWGFVVASVDGTRFNCTDGDRRNISLRSDSQIAALEALSRLNEEASGPFERRLDLDQVVFAGHSRGGGASLVTAREVPDQTIGIIDLQGIDLTGFGFGTRSLPDIPALGITADRDVDLHYPAVEPTEDQLGGAYAWVNINGGIHAFTADGAPVEFDDRPAIRRRQQHDVTELFTTALLADVAGLPRRHGGPREFVPAARDILFTHRGSELVARQISQRGVYHRWRSPHDAIWVDYFDGDDEETNALDGSNTHTGFLRAAEVPTYRPDTDKPGARYGKSRSLLLSAATPGVFETRLDADGSLDVSHVPTLLFRAKGPDNGPLAIVEVEFVAEDGTITRVPMNEHRGPLPLSNRFQQVTIPVPARLPPLKALRFHVAGGTIFIDDLRFGAR